jgi:hypothetical protein
MDGFVFCGLKKSDKKYFSKFWDLDRDKIVFI